MNIVPFLVGCSLLLAAGAVILFVLSARNRDHEHADRLSLLPLEDDLLPEVGPADTGSPASRSTDSRSVSDDDAHD
jgi:hypothetical protein